MNRIDALQNNREAGNRSNGQNFTLQESQRQCRWIARNRRENFVVASVLLPRRLRQPFYDLYAYCRTADDLADHSPTPELALQRLQAFGEQLEQTFAGAPPGGIFVALHETIRQFQLPREPFEALLDAFRQDQRVTRYESEQQLLDYCRRSANPVGILVLHLADCCDAQTARWSDQICTALQLANFWQDVARDFSIGRIYLPRETMNQFGVSEAMLQQPSTPLPLRQLLADHCDRAEARFRDGLPLADHVPSWLATDVKLFAHGGLATLDAIRRIDFDVLRVRPTIGRWRQFGLLAQALLRRI